MNRLSNYVKWDEDNTLSDKDVSLMKYLNGHEKRSEYGDLPNHPVEFLHCNIFSSITEFTSLKTAVKKGERIISCIVKELMTLEKKYDLVFESLSFEKKKLHQTRRECEFNQIGFKYQKKEKKETNKEEEDDEILLFNIDNKIIEEEHVITRSDKIMIFSILNLLIEAINKVKAQHQIDISHIIVNWRPRCKKWVDENGEFFIPHPKDQIHNYQNTSWALYLLNSHGSIFRPMSLCNLKKRKGEDEDIPSTPKGRKIKLIKR